MDYFHLKQYNTTYRSEIFAGLSTFLAIAYILILNPAMLSQLGMDSYGVFVATALSIAITTGIAGFYTRLPMVYAPSIGLSSIFLILATEQFHGDWRMALLAVYLSGVCTIIVLRYKGCKRILLAVPESVVYGVVTGIGLSLIKMGLFSCGVIEKSTSIYYEIGYIWTYQFRYCFIGILIILLFVKLKKNHGLTYGFFCVSIVGVIISLMKAYECSGESFFNFTIGVLVHKLNLTNLTEVAFCFPTFEAVTSSAKQVLELILIVFLMVIITLVISQWSIQFTIQKIREENEAFSKKKFTRCFKMIGIGNIVSGVVGCPPVSACVENKINIECGARTGVSALTVSVAMVMSLLIGPLFIGENMFVSAPLLIFTGGMLIKSVKINHVNSPIERLLFLFITIYLGLTFYLIDAVLYGMLFYIIMNVLTGKRKQLDHSMIFWILSSVIYIAVQVL